MQVDLHIHTTYSDGIDSPEKIVSLAKSAGTFKILCADHTPGPGQVKKSGACGNQKDKGCNIITHHNQRNDCCQTETYANFLEHCYHLRQRALELYRKPAGYSRE